MPRTDITTCLFDLDGTLIDSEIIWIEAIQASLAAKGIGLSIDVVTRIEYGCAWKEIFHSIHSQWPDAYPTIQEMEAFTIPYYERVTATRDISIHGSITLLKRLATEGYAVGIVTGSKRERVEAVIAKLELAPYVKGYVGGEDYSNGKPAPDAYLAGARLLGARPEQCIAFEDAPAGIASAKAAGMLCVALDTVRGYAPRTQDARHGTTGSVRGTTGSVRGTTCSVRGTTCSVRGTSVPRLLNSAEPRPDLVLGDLAEFTFSMLP